MTRNYFLFSLVILMVAGDLIASTIRVPTDFPTIQEGINATVNGDTVLVSAGVYYENLNFHGRAIVLTSESGAQVTFIDGGNSGPIITLTSGEGAGTTICGFTLQNGRYSWGAGVTMQSSSATIISNIFQNNLQNTGGYGAGIGCNNSSPVIVKNTFRFNYADAEVASGVISVFGYSSPLIANNIFLNNSCCAINLGVPAEYSPDVINNTLVGNLVGIEILGGGSVLVSSNICINNILFENTCGLDMPYTSLFNLPTWKNNLVFGGTPYLFAPDQTGQSGNISADPLFACLGHNDFRLQTNSPCIDAGNNNAPRLPIDDFDGQPRIIAGATNSTPVVDIGAYEFNPTMTPTTYSNLVVVCPPPFTVQCGIPADVMISVGGVSDQLLTATWSLNGTIVQTNVISIGNLGIGTNISLTANLPLGTNLVEVLVGDGLGNNSEDSTVVTIIDTVGPVVFCPTNMAVDFSDQYGAPVFFSASADDLCSGSIPVNSTPASGSIFPIGTNLVYCIATDDHENSRQNNFSITVLGAKGVTAAVLDELKTLRLRIPQQRAPLWDNALTNLTRSLASNLWLNETHLTARMGEKFFAYERTSLLLIDFWYAISKSTLTKPDWDQAVARLLRADRLLATVAINEAKNAGATNRQINKAQNDFARGDDFIVKSDYVSAIDKYAGAWKQAEGLVIKLKRIP